MECLPDVAGGEARAEGTERNCEDEDADMCDAADAPDTAKKEEEESYDYAADDAVPGPLCGKSVECARWRMLLGGGDETRQSAADRKPLGKPVKAFVQGRDVSTYHVTHCNQHTARQESTPCFGPTMKPGACLPDNRWWRLLMRGRECPPSRGRQARCPRTGSPTSRRRRGSRPRRRLFRARCADNP